MIDCQKHKSRRQQPCSSFKSLPLHPPPDSIQMEWNLLKCHLMIFLYFKCTLDQDWGCDWAPKVQNHVQVWCECKKCSNSSNFKNLRICVHLQQRHGPWLPEWKLQIFTMTIGIHIYSPWFSIFKNNQQDLQYSPLFSLCNADSVSNQYHFHSVLWR